MSGNIYLVGFMGTGKTVVGKFLARRLRRPFVDSDAAIERLARSSVARIFARRGEEAFRALESRVVSGLGKRTRVVASMGGGVLLSAANRGLLESSGVLILLTCSETELWRRLRPELSSRPLLSAGRPALRSLLRRRRGLYGGALMRVSTTRRSASAAASEIARRLSRRGLR